MKHTFAICAYKESPYLEECIQSLKKQTIESNIVMATSTPNDTITSLGEKYHIPVYVNEGESGIAGDWNFAYSCASTEYVTIAHQDDIYLPDYAERIVEKLEQTENPLIAFSDYAELKGEIAYDNTMNLKIKRFLLHKLKRNGEKRSRKRSALRLGNGICCPSVTFVRKNMLTPVFASHFRSNVDWQTWERISEQDGAFVYCDDILMYHRIHDGSETSAVIGENLRTKEDYEMFCKFWPKWVAKIITKVYSLSEKSNG